MHTIGLEVIDTLTGETFLEVEVKGNEKVYRDKAYKAFCGVLTDLDLSFKEIYPGVCSSKRVDLYELIYRGYLIRKGKDATSMEVGVWTVKIRH